MSTVILTCETLSDHINAAQEKCNTNFPVIWLDRRLHVEPSHMRDHIIGKLSELSQEVDTVLVAMGFCGGSWQDVSCDKRLIIPRVDDCVTIAMTKTDIFNPCTKEPGHMYLFGHGGSGFSIKGIHDQLMDEHDPETAEFLFDSFFAHYSHLDIIDTGLYDCYSEEYVIQAQADADLINADLGYVSGGNRILEKLVTGCWDEQFLIVLPETKITQGLFF